MTRRYKKFTENEDDRIREMCFSGYSIKKIAKELDRQPAIIHKRKTILGLTKHKINTHIKWDKDTYRYLIYQINKWGNKLIAQTCLGLDFKTINEKILAGMQLGYINETEGQRAIKVMK